MHPGYKGPIVPLRQYGGFTPGSGLFKVLFSPQLFAFLLTALSLTLHLGWLAEPNELVYDEVHYAKYVSGYLSGEYFFDSHPPLGKLMIAGVARLAGVTPFHGVQRIGVPYPNKQYIWLRLLPALFGSLLAPLIYLVALRSTRSRGAAATAGVFVLLDNALLAQSKFILLDAFVLLLGFVSLYLFWQCKLFFPDGRWGKWSALGAAVAAGLCITTKWNGIGFWGLLLLLASYSLVSKFWTHGTVDRRVLLSYVSLVGLPLFLYIAAFFIHFALLSKPGPGNWFMTARFQTSQAMGYPLRDFPANLWELNRTMYASHLRTTPVHPYGSSWYMWPLMRQPVYYWNSRVGISSRRIYLIGNPVVWWISGLLTVTFLLRLMWRFVSQGQHRPFQPHHTRDFESGVNPPRYGASLLLMMGYVANLLPFAGFGRVRFLYYYLASLIFSILITSTLLGYIQRWRKTVFGALFALTPLGFFAVAPVTFGTGVNEWPFWGSSQLLSILLPHQEVIAHPGWKS
jgi:dolichyl-phosphate-mannose-protein mannosyltransferase